MSKQCQSATFSNLLCTPDVHTPDIPAHKKGINSDCSTPPTPTLSMIGTPLLTCSLREVDEDMIMSRYCF